MSDQKPEYDCPACDRKFTAKEKKGSNCPCGKVKLEIVREKKVGGPGFQFRYKLAEGQQNIKDESAKPPAKRGPEARGGVRQESKNEIPEIWKMPDKYTSGKMRSVYEVWYIGIQYTGFVYCPCCWSKLWQNIYMDSGGSGIETICKKCSSLVTFFFHADQRVYHPHAS